jgi:MinD-like ATPase involved in chromosome partitioning or flagellar assembly
LARTIGIVSIKGGVGKTSITTALGAVLAKKYNQKVLLVDANFSAPSLALHLGLVNPEVTIHHVLNDKIEPENAIYESDLGVHLIPGSMALSNIDPFKLRSKLKTLQKHYDIILIDSSPTLNNEILASILASDEVYVVTTPDKITLNATLNTINLAKQKKTPISGIIVNKAYNKNFEVDDKQIESDTDLEIIAFVPHETGVLKSLSEMSPLSHGFGFSREIHKLAANIIGDTHKVGLLEKFRNFLSFNKPRYKEESLVQELEV